MTTHTRKQSFSLMATVAAVLMCSHISVANAALSKKQSDLNIHLDLDKKITQADIRQLQTNTWDNHILSQYQPFEMNLDKILNVDDLFSFLTQPQYVEVRINDDGSALTEDVLPQVVSELGYEDFSLANQNLASGTLPSGVTLFLACHNSSAQWDLNMNNIDISLPLDNDSVLASFRDDGRINSDLEIDRLSLEFDLQFIYPDNVGGFYCNAFGSTYNFKVSVNVDGASGEFDIQTDAINQHTYVDDIKKFELDVDSVSFDSSFLTSLTNIGISVSDLFGSGCSSLTQCVNNALDEQLTNNTVIQNKLKDAMNDALERALALEGGFNIGPTKVDYSVGLEDLISNNSKDRLTSVWDVAFDSDQADDACADQLFRTNFFPGNSITTGNDLEIVLPFKKITDLLYVLGKKGALCASQSIPGTLFGRMDADVKPVGSFDVVSVDDNVLELTVPMQATADIATTSGEVTADLVLTAAITPACGSGLSLTIEDVAFESVAGEIKWTLLGQTVVLDASEFVSDMADDLARDIEAALDEDITVLPESFGLQDITRYVATGDVVSNNSAIAVGVNVVNYDPNCD